MSNVRTVQSTPHSMTVQVYNAQVLVKRVHERYYQVECNILTPIGLVPCEYKGHLCWHSCLAMNRVLNPPSIVDWFDRRSDAFWMWAGNSNPMNLVHIESKQRQRTIAHGWAVVRGMVSDMELGTGLPALENRGA